MLREVARTSGGAVPLGRLLPYCNRTGVLQQVQVVATAGVPGHSDQRAATAATGPADQDRAGSTLG